jgi:hypothetical protein
MPSEPQSSANAASFAWLIVMGIIAAVSLAAPIVRLLTPGPCLRYESRIEEEMQTIIMVGNVPIITGGGQRTVWVCVQRGPKTQ